MIISIAERIGTEMNTPSSTKKYRPYFTLPELEFLASAVRKSSLSAGESPPIDLLRYLESYIHDIKQGYRKENHTLQPTLAQKLELDDSPRENTGQKLSRMQNLYLAWQANASLTLPELEIVEEYRYLHDLMSPTEESRYESKKGITF